MATSQYVEQIWAALSTKRAEMPNQGEQNMPTIAEQFWKEDKKKEGQKGKKNESRKLRPNYS